MFELFKPSTHALIWLLYSNSSVGMLICPVRSPLSQHKKDDAGRDAVLLSSGGIRMMWDHSFHVTRYHFAFLRQTFKISGILDIGSNCTSIWWMRYKTGKFRITLVWLVMRNISPVYKTIKPIIMLYNFFLSFKSVFVLLFILWRSTLSLLVFTRLLCYRTLIANKRICARKL